MSKIWSAVRLVMIVSVRFPTAGLAYVAEPEDEGGLGSILPRTFRRGERQGWRWGGSGRRHREDPGATAPQYAGAGCA
jgi:hypothetical protein